VRFATLNLWGTRPPLDRRLEVAAAGLAEADVVLLQEVRVAADIPNTAERLAALLGGWHVAYAAGTRGEAGTFGPGSTAGEEGVAIIARDPILESRSVELPEAKPDERRVLLSARIGPVWAHTTHLHWRLLDGVARERQVLAIDMAIAAIRDQDADPVHVLGGDFNAAPDCDEIRFLRGRHTLDGRRTYWQDAWRVVHGEQPGWTWTRKNPMTEWLKFLELDRRIDYLFTRQERRDGRGAIREARVILDTPSEDGVWASDHFGVVAEIVTTASSG
jgi:endonuclease/exonuclease/phosphatase family metal-dependent hydrolase